MLLSRAVAPVSGGLWGCFNLRLFRRVALFWGFWCFLQFSGVDVV